jgi:hypothetical protein
MKEQPQEDEPLWGHKAGFNAITALPPASLYILMREPKMISSYTFIETHGYVNPITTSDNIGYER